MNSLTKVTPRQKRVAPYNLDENQIHMIEEALTSLGEFGEVRLVVEKGRLRFVVVQKSYDALQWLPGQLDVEPGK